MIVFGRSKHLILAQFHAAGSIRRYLFTNGQTFILGIVMMVSGLMEYGGHVRCGVTAHGSPSGPLQFDRLEAALAASFHRTGKSAVLWLGASGQQNADSVRRPQSLHVFGSGVVRCADHSAARRNAFGQRPHT
jgi:hypothetical protein